MTKDKWMVMVWIACSLCLWLIAIAIASYYLSIPRCDTCLTPLSSEEAQVMQAFNSQDELYIGFRFANDSPEREINLIASNPWFAIEKAFLKPSCEMADHPWLKLDITPDQGRVLVPQATACATILVAGKSNHANSADLAAVFVDELQHWQLWSKRISQLTLGFLLAALAFNFVFFIFDLHALNHTYLVCLCAAALYVASFYWPHVGSGLTLAMHNIGFMQTLLCLLFILLSSQFIIHLLLKASDFAITALTHNQKAVTLLVLTCAVMLFLPIPFYSKLYSYWAAFAVVVVCITQTHAFSSQREKHFLLATSALILCLSWQVLLSWTAPSLFKPELTEHSIQLFLVTFSIIQIFQFALRLNQESAERIAADEAAIKDMMERVTDVLAKEKNQLELIENRRQSNQELEDQVKSKRQSIETSIEKLDSERQALTMQSRIDPLTRLYNRRYFFEVAADFSKSSQTTGTKFHIAFLDLDHFKTLNDEHGHLAGDQALSHTAMTLSMATQPLGSYVAIGRLGGEEFAIAATKIDKAEFKQFLESIRQQISSAPVKIGGHVLNITLSIGFVSVNAYHKQPIDELLKRADQALLKAKGSGRNCVIEWSQDV